MAGVYCYQPCITCLSQSHHKQVEASMPKLHKNRREFVLVVPAAHVSSSFHVLIVKLMLSQYCYLYMKICIDLSWASLLGTVAAIY